MSRRHVWIVVAAIAASSCDSSSSDDKDDGETEETETNPQPNGCSQSQFAFNGTPEERSVVVSVCLDTCTATPGLINGIDPGNCTDTIELAKTVNSDFDFVCESGLGG